MVVPSAFCFWYKSSWARFEFSVFEYCKIDSAVVHRTIIHPNALLYRRRVIGVGQMAGLCPLGHLYKLGRHYISAFIIFVGPAPTGTPKVALVNIVVVRDANRWNIFCHVTICPAPEVPFIKIIEHGLIQRFSNGNGGACAFINLVAAEKQYVRLVLQYICDDIIMRKPEPVSCPRKCAGIFLFSEDPGKRTSVQSRMGNVVIACKAGQNYYSLFHGVPPYRAGVVIRFCRAIGLD